MDNAPENLGDTSPLDEQPAPTTKTTPPKRQFRSETIGHYKTLEILGEGGMGVVYRAQQTEPVKREVALKLIKLGMDTKQVIARFESERQALALMDHPNVAKVFDAGATDRGRPYFVMELVHGLPITEHCDRHRLSIDQRLNLFMKTCEAIQHAHQKGIIHRDMKPSNVLVEFVNGHGMPKIIDFGVAKATSQRLTEKTLFTEQGQLIGTPSYMSPEQADLSVQDVDTRSDIYSLGVLLYELLTGMLPFDPRSLRSAGFTEIQRIIRYQEPPKPSTRMRDRVSRPSERFDLDGSSHVGSSISAHRVEPDADESGNQPDSVHGETAKTEAYGSAVELARLRRSDPRTLIRRIRGDLDWIVMKCLEKDRTRRYETANSLAMDIGRHLNDEPVLAGPPSVDYRFRKFVRRHRSLIIGVCAVATIMAIAAFLSVHSAITQAQLRGDAKANRVQADLARQTAGHLKTEAYNARRNAARHAEITRTIINILLAASDQGGKSTDMHDVLKTASRTIEGKFRGEPLVEAKIRATLGEIHGNLGEFEEAIEHLERALFLRREVLGETDRETLSTMSVLADLYESLGRRDEAESLYRKLVAQTRNKYGDNNYMTLRRTHHLAEILVLHKKFGEAMPLVVGNWKLIRRKHGTLHPETLAAVELGITLYSSWNAAEPGKGYAEKAAEWRTKLP